MRLTKASYLGSEDVIDPGMVNLSFNIELFSKAKLSRMLVSNIGRAIVKKLQAVKFEGNEILSVDDFDVFACYQDLWETDSEKWNTVRQGIMIAALSTA